jgi:hypothetical protein
LRDIMSKLTQYDEIMLLELLNISAEELVERFIDKIEERFEILERELND